MEVINKKVVLVLFLIGIFSYIFIWQNISDKETMLEMVSLNNEEKSSSMFAIMLEQEDGTYEESTDNTWPNDGTRVYNEEMSGCINASGNEITGILDYDSENKIAKIKTTSASYCYLYFSIPKWCDEGETAGECLLRNPTTSLNNTSMEGGMYRYQGTTADNYICFGTTSQTDCLANKTLYLYRIIGIDANNQLKLRKLYSVGNKTWHNSIGNITWPNSDLFKALNGLETDTITSIFVNNSMYDYMTENSTWYNKVATTSWRYGDTTSNGSYNGETIYAIENAFGDSTSTSAWTNTVSAKVSLMYIHDYYYAYGVGGNPGTTTEAKTAWISPNDEWTMSRYGYFSGAPQVWHLYLYSGSVSRDDGRSSHLVHPVFFLESSTQIIKGTGLYADPFVIK